MTRIVVGIDGSTHAEAALDWALRTAAVSHHEITAISAWEPSGGSPLRLDLGMRTHLAEGLGEASLALAEEAIAAARDRSPGSKNVAISALALEGIPGTVLVHAARSAEFPVVGRHGRGAFGLNGLGSVAAHCLHHSRGPVVVVPPGTGLLGSELPFDSRGGRQQACCQRSSMDGRTLRRRADAGWCLSTPRTPTPTHHPRPWKLCVELTAPPGGE